MSVYLSDVLLPVAMVTPICLLGYGRYPDSIHPQALDVVQLAQDALEGPSTVTLQVTTGLASIASLSKPVNQELEQKK